MEEESRKETDRSSHSAAGEADLASKAVSSGTGVIIGFKSDAAENGDRPNCAKMIKSRKPKDTSKMYMENHTSRTKNAKLRGMSLIKAAEKFEKKFGGKVLVKVEYTSVGKKVFCYRYGKDFNFTGSQIITVDNSQAEETPSDEKEEANWSMHADDDGDPGPTTSLGLPVTDSDQNALCNSYEVKIEV